MPFEIPIWEKWLSLHEGEYTSFSYDIRVGESILPPPGLDANIAEMAVSLTKKRIDVVAWNGPNPTIIEIKDYAGLTAIGQLISYPILFTREFPESPQPAVMLIAKQLMPDVAFVLDFFEIPYEIVVPDYQPA